MLTHMKWADERDDTVNAGGRVVEVPDKEGRSLRAHLQQHLRSAACALDARQRELTEECLKLSKILFERRDPAWLLYAP